MRIDLLPDRLADKIEPEPMSGCWLWTGAKTGWGYGYFKASGTRKNRHAHQEVYELLVGPVPDRLELDHLCRNRLCVSPWHLEAVTHQVNTRRAAPFNRKTHCKRGHEFTPENTYLHPGPFRRACRTCMATRLRRRIR